MVSGVTRYLGVTRAWSRANKALCCASCFIGSRPHPRAIFSVMHSHGTLTSIIIIINNNTFIDRRKPGWLISHTYIMPYISIECNLKDMNTNWAKAVNTCGSRACIKYRNLSFTLRKTKLGLSLHTILTRCSRNESYFGHTQTKWSSSSTLSQSLHRRR